MHDSIGIISNQILFLYDVTDVSVHPTQSINLQDSSRQSSPQGYLPTDLCFLL